MNTGQKDQQFLEKARILAMDGGLSVRPNPYVGAVVVKDGRIISTGYHRQYGGMHTEAEALKRAGSQAAGADSPVRLHPVPFTMRTNTIPPARRLSIKRESAGY